MNENKGLTHINVGDILVSAWGYSMTLYDFFEVINKTGKSLTLRELKKKNVGEPVGFLKSKVQPILGEYTSGNLVRRPSKKHNMIHGTLDTQTIFLDPNYVCKYNPQDDYIEDHAD